MSSSWELLESSPDLLEKFRRSLNSIEDLIRSLEERGFISSDSVDDPGVSKEEIPIRLLVSRIITKDEASYCRFKRTLIENGEYDAVEVLSDLSPIQDSDLQQHQGEASRPYPRITDFAQASSTHQSEWPTSSRLSSSVFSLEPLTGQPGSSAREEVDAKLASEGASSSSAATSTSGRVAVKKAKKIKSGSRVYELTKSPRGLCVIFNNRTFPSMRTKDRPGSELDVERMRVLFEEFNFKVCTHVDQPSHLIMSLLDSYANETCFEGHQAFVLILMSHGGLNHIYGSDYGEVKLQDIFEKFNNFNCPALREIPKMFFIQACRGDQPDNGTPGRDPTAEPAVEDDDYDEAQSDAGMFRGRESGLGRICPTRRISCWSDTYIAYAVVEGYESLRDLRSGSWFLKAVFDVMARHAHAEDLDTLMERVSERVLEKVRNDGQRQCPEIKKIGWRKKLYFNPGLSE